MEENKTQTNEKSLGFWLFVLVALFAGVVGIFAMLEMVVPQGVERGSGTWTSLYSQSGAPSPYSMRMMGEKDRKSSDVSAWLTASGDYIAQELDGEERDAAFWLWRQDSDEYVLYLPGQDRVLTGADISAGEEKDDDGSKRLVIRIRTPENGEEIVPKEQLLSFRTESAGWNGIRLTILMDGREQDVRVMTSIGDKLYTSEQAYMGRS